MFRISSQDLTSSYTYSHQFRTCISHCFVNFSTWVSNRHLKLNLSKLNSLFTTPLPIFSSYCFPQLAIPLFFLLRLKPQTPNWPLFCSHVPSGIWQQVSLAKTWKYNLPTSWTSITFLVQASIISLYHNSHGLITELLISCPSSVSSLHSNQSDPVNAWFQSWTFLLKTLSWLPRSLSIKAKAFQLFMKPYPSLSSISSSLAALTLAH